MGQLLLAVIYAAFISLGLPDSVLGAAWPSMYGGLGVPLSWSGAVFMIIALGTILSSLMSDRLTRRFGTGVVTAFSVLMTAAALFGFSVSDSYWQLCLWAIPYGLGAGSVDASINNYVALHYASRHMSWLHCMWGLGASLGPYIMGLVLTGGLAWNSGYRLISGAQLLLTLLLFLSLPLWKRREGEGTGEQQSKALGLRELLKMPGALQIMLTFFCYCALEQTTGLWAGSYLVLNRGFHAEEAAAFASLFFLGITVGRMLSGFMTLKFSDTQMIRLGAAGIALGLLILLLPLGRWGAWGGLCMLGLGCAPIYPSIIHSTPANFGADRSQALIGVQMASAYIGTCLMPPLFGLAAERWNVGLLPLFLLLLLGIMLLCFEDMLKKLKKIKRPPCLDGERGL